ncbi:rhodanese-like domain-containing protein [Uliginosibacterium flavum]|uniref:Rhodanese-like domain-containing protein n=1 Tax=Uliginosibacterium flavum TaxID=1396831 RepID=A0ABV2TII6_9RHOO
MEFVTQNIFLIVIAAVSGFALFLPVLRDARANSITPGQAVMLINRQHAVIVDVRDTEELASGHIVNSQNIPLASLAERAAELGKNKTRPVILVCASGARSGKGVEILRKAGFEQVFNLDGGIKGWKDAGQSLVIGKKA